MNLSLILSFCVILGFLLYKRNTILMFIFINIITSTIIFLLVSSLHHEGILRQIYAVYLIAIVGAILAFVMGIMIAHIKYIVKNKYKWDLWSFIKNKSLKDKPFVYTPFKDTFCIFYSGLTLFIVPIFLFNIYIFNFNSLFMSWFTVFGILLISFSLYIWIFFISLNYYHGNNSNIYVKLWKLRVIYISNRKNPLFLFYVILLLILIIVYILGLNYIITYFVFIPESSNSSLLYIWVRLSMFPTILYLSNILMSLVKKYYTKDYKIIIDYSLCSKNMFNYLTISSWLTIFSLTCVSYNCKGLIELINDKYTHELLYKIEVWLCAKLPGMLRIPIHNTNVSKVTFNWLQYAELGKNTRRLCQIYSSHTEDINIKERSTLLADILHYKFASGVTAEVGFNVPNIRSRFYMTYGINVDIHPSVFVQMNCIILDTPVTKIVIDKNTAIGINCLIIGVGHPRNSLVRSGPMSSIDSWGKDIIIGKGVRVMANSVILPGTVLGDYSVVEANSVVNGKIILPHHTTNGKVMWASPKGHA